MKRWLAFFASVLFIGNAYGATYCFTAGGWTSGATSCTVGGTCSSTRTGAYIDGPTVQPSNCGATAGQLKCHIGINPTTGCLNTPMTGDLTSYMGVNACVTNTYANISPHSTYSDCFTISGVTSCPSGQSPNAEGFCNPCAVGETYDKSTDSCIPPACVAGTAFVGVGSDTAPKCLDGCSYAISAPAVYGEVVPGVVGVHSRWVASGSSCTAADELVPADVTGCPDEVSPDMRAAICGIPAPCEAGEFLFSGECVADSAETGCVIVDGEQVCAEAEQNCVVINGKRVCAEVPEGPEDLQTYKENGCVWSFAQAAWVCPTDTATTTKTGTTTTTTDPVTGEKTTTSVTTTRNSVTGGTTTTTTTVVTDADGNELSRDVVEQTTGTGGEGGTLLAREPEALGEKPDLDWLRTAQEVKDNLSAQWEAVPLVVAVSSLSDMQLTGIEGVCPEFCLPLWGETLCTTKHCEIWATVSFIISGVLLALYGMAAMRIVLSA